MLKETSSHTREAEYSFSPIGVIAIELSGSYFCLSKDAQNWAGEGYLLDGTASGRIKFPPALHFSQNCLLHNCFEKAVDIPLKYIR